jgi:hypothetical protein
MKFLKYLLTLAAVTVALTFSAQAHLNFLGDVDFFSNKPNSPDANLVALQNFLGAATPPGLALCGNFENLSGDTTISVMPGAYLVVHYGKGSGGDSKGGSLEFFQVVDGETSVTVPGFPNPADTHATGGISSIREFCANMHVPDSGATAMLLGSALAGLGLMRRFLKR